MVDRLAELGALQYAAANTATASVNPSRIAASGYIHAMYAEYVTWSLANPGVNPSRLSAKGRIFGYFYDNATFSPLSLFAASEVGAWYDPSDLTTMFQDSAGTTPVTADGQPVGKILDKSGRGNHASQATAAARPLYKTDGTYSWLQFDGVDDSLSTAAIDFTSTDKMSVFSGNYFANNTGNQSVTALSSDPDAVAGSFRYDRNVATSRLQLGSVGVRLLSSYALSSPIKSVSSQSYRFDSGGSIALRHNGAAVILTPVVTDAITPRMFANSGLFIGSQGGTSSLFNGNVYSLIVRGALSTTQEITDTETWVAAKTGVTL